jgi:glycine C-acetyltransferase
MIPPGESITAELASLEARGLRRRMPEVSGKQQAEVVVDGIPAINFCSNNYLGLADHPSLASAAARALEAEGVGAGASRLIAGNLAAHRSLEARIAAWQGTEAALLFNSGYQANVGVLSALAGPEDAIYSDQLNHASLIDGARLSRAAVHVYPHRDTTTLAAMLSAGHGYRRRLIVSDSLFSVDGDRAPLAALARLAGEHHALLIVDEAHAVGALGPCGVGLAARSAADLRIGTLGKALGVFGAYAAGSRSAIDLLINRARSFVFTTALPPSVAAAACAAIELLCSSSGTQRQQQLASRCARLHAGLRSLGLAPPSEADVPPAHIVPLLVGDAARTMLVSQRLLERGLFVQGIRPPTVPEGSSRLRLTVMASHSDAHLDAALSALAALRADLHPLTP